MVNDFEIKVPISIKGGEAKVGKKLADDFLKNIKGSFSGFGFGKKGDTQSNNIMPGIGKIAASVGIIASIWQGIAPILKPVLKMLSILLTILLLPLMPLIKQMVSGLAKTAQNVSQAQEEAGGGYAGFIAGMAEIMKSPTIWALAGVGLAASFVASLGTLGIAGLISALISLDLLWDLITNGDEKTLTEKLKTAGWAGMAEIMKSPTIWALAGVGLAASFIASLGTLGIAGLVMGLISLDLIWDAITSGDEKTLDEKLKSAGWAGLSASIAALIFGAGIAALPIGVLTLALTFGISLIASAMKEEDLKTALLMAAGGSAMLGLVAAGIFALLGLGGGGVVALAVGTIIFTLFAAWKFGGLDAVKQSIENTGIALKEIDKEVPLFSAWETPLNLLKSSFTDIGTGMEDITPKISTMNTDFTSFFNTTNENALFMRDVSIEATNEVIENLSRIPREINTTHYIRTVHI